MAQPNDSLGGQCQFAKEGFFSYTPDPVCVVTGKSAELPPHSWPHSHLGTKKKSVQRYRQVGGVPRHVFATDIDLEEVLVVNQQDALNQCHWYCARRHHGCSGVPPRWSEIQKSPILGYTRSLHWSESDRYRLQVGWKLVSFQMLFQRNSPPNI